MRFWGLAVLCALAACGDDSNSPVDAPPPDDIHVDAPPDGPFMPMRLADTGLCVDTACTQISPGVYAYAPQYELYSDGATKRRWLYLPPGMTIDTTDMNYWKFPVGTKLWKEFTRDGVRVETRFMTKLLADDSAVGAWFFASYQWNATTDDTTLASPSAGVMNANGTMHDIPSRSQCRRCHENTPGRALGVNAMSLDFSAPAGSLDLADLVAMNLLSAPPAAPGSVGAPYFPLPGTAVDQAAFGYLHANCGGCHNPTSSIYATTTMELRLDVTKLNNVNMIPARSTTVNVNGTVGGLTDKIVDPGNPTGSVMIIRMNSAVFPTKMPEIGTETVDPVGQSALTAWINQPP